MISGPLTYRVFRETGPRARTRTARSGDERTNHEATAPPTKGKRKENECETEKFGDWSDRDGRANPFSSAHAIH